MGIYIFLLTLILLFCVTLFLVRIFWLSIRPLYNTNEVPIKADIVIIGGGTSGCVLARRLSEKYPNKQIVLLERGDDQSRNPEIYRSENALNIAYKPPYSLVMNSEYPGVLCTMGTMMGGSSSHNYGLVVTGSPEMYRREWLDKLKLSEKDLEKYISRVFSEIQTTTITPKVNIFPKIMPLLDITLKEGPIPLIQAANVYFNLGVLRADDKLSKNMTKAIEKSCIDVLKKRVPIVDNYNKYNSCISESQILYINPITGTRASANTQYLPQSYRPQNLTIVTSANVDKIEKDIVKLDAPFSKRKEIKASKIIISSGGLLSPYLLAKSGIIANESLKNTLVNHYGTQYIFAIKNIQDFASGPLAYLPNIDSDNRELQIITSGSSLTNLDLLKRNGVKLEDYKDYTLVTYIVFLLNPRNRGTLKYIPGKDVPEIQLNLYNPEDMKNLILGKNLIYSNYLSLKENYDIIPVLPDISTLESKNERTIEDSIKRGLITADHYSCTLSNLVNENFKIAPNIHVVDNSILPHITDGNTQFPAMLIAEIASDRI